MDEVFSNFQPVTITRERFQELLVAEEDARRLKKLIYDTAENFGNISNTELRLLVAFLNINMKKNEESPSEPDESEDVENG